MRLVWVNRGPYVDFKMIHFKKINKFVAWKLSLHITLFAQVIDDYKTAHKDLEWKEPSQLGLCFSSEAVVF